VAVASARITAFLKAVADAGADLLAKIAYGTPGSYVAFPESTPENEAVTGPRETGQIYPGVVIPGLLDQVGAEMDRAACVWACIDAMPSGTPPVILGKHTNVLSASKVEISCEITVNLSPAYLAADFFYMMWLVKYGFAAIPIFTTQTSASFAGYFVDLTGNSIDINNKVVLAFACGQV